MWRAALAIAVGTGCGHAAATAPGAVDYPTLDPDGGPIDPYFAPEPAPWATEVADEDRFKFSEAIFVDKELGDPRFVEAMEVRVRAGDFALPSAANHRVEREAPGVQRVRIATGPGAKVTRGERADALRATLGTDADAATVGEAARRATAGDRTRRARVTSLVHWIHDEIAYVRGEETVASAVLAARTGDCSEMSLLFVAMARALDIPARRVVGLAGTYVADKPAFGYHAWAEVELDGRWVQVDPTWNEPIADATHIAIGRGEGDEWADGFVGIELSIVDVVHAPGAGDYDPRALARELPAHLVLRPRAARDSARSGARTGRSRRSGR
jgi:transglutaminase-like putative cysteine protease